MNLFILKSRNAIDRYDEMHGCVVNAYGYTDARNRAAKGAGDEGKALWKDPTRSTCKRLKPGKRPGIVIVDFHAG
jgi:hypothetical protein